MSEIKVSQMPEASNINDNDLLMIIQGGYNKKIPKELLEIPTKAHQVNVGEDTDYRVNLLKTKNLCDINTMKILGSYNDSEYVSSPNYVTLQFIKVKPGTTYTVKTNLDLTKYTALRIVDFNSNQTFIRRSSGISYTTSNYTFTTSNDAYYIALAFYTNDTASLTDITQAQVEEGSTATTYEPFISNQINVDNEKFSDTINVGVTEDSRSRVNVLKSRNLLDFNNISSYSSTNVTATPSYTDGKLDYINVTKSASQSSNEFITLKDFIFEYPTGDYILSGCPSGGGNNSYTLYLQNATAGTDVSPRDIGEGAEVTLTKGIRYKLYLRMASTAVFSDKKFYPMLRKATDTNDTYEPYIVPSIKVDNEMLVSKNVYSTSEVVIGEWLGKPLYRKCFEKTSLAVGDNTITTGLTIDTLVRLDCNLYRSNGIWYTLTFANSSNMNAAMSISYQSGTISINIGSAITNASKCYVIMEYTKS